MEIVGSSIFGAWPIVETENVLSVILCNYTSLKGHYGIKSKSLKSLVSQQHANDIANASGNMLFLNVELNFM